MEAVNMLRAVLVGGAVLAAIFAAAFQRWSVVFVMLIAVVAHGFLWVYLRRLNQPPTRRPH
ncbi:MAG: hypothetical protein ACRDU8_10540 [Egibacteraceae bacterium]